MHSMGISHAGEDKPQVELDFPEGMNTKELSALLSKNGRYQAQYEAFYDLGIEKQQGYIFVWDTQTGKSKIYMCRTGDSSFEAVSSSGFQPSVIP